MEISLLESNLREKTYNKRDIVNDVFSISGNIEKSKCPVKDKIQAANGTE